MESQVVENKLSMDELEAKYLPNRKVSLRPIVRTGGTWLKPGHDGEFMYTGCKRSYVLPIDGKRRQLVNILNREEQEFFEKKLYMNPGDLSIYKQKDNFWAAHRFHVDVTKDGLTLDLSDPMDGLRYRVLKLNEEIAPSWAQRFDSGNYKFALVEEGEQILSEVTKANKLQEAYKFLSSIEASIERMSDFLRVYGKRPPADAKKDFLKAELQKLIDSDIDGYLAVARDKDFQTKVIIDMSLEIGALMKEGKLKIALPGGDVIGTMEETVEFLRNKKNSDILATLKAKIDTASNTRVK